MSEETQGGAGTCGSCGAESDLTRRYCADCGAPLPSLCDCGFSNSPSVRFCGGCGKERAGTPAAPRVEGERRQVTVLFADLAGYTSLSSRHDPEQIRDLLEQFFERVDGVTLSFGGSINQHVGDAVLALFGAPVAHGNDAERAVAAALAIHDAVAELHAPDGTPLAVHVGVASGVVVAATTGSRAHRAYTVTGSSVNLASRLMDLGSAGETLISEPVRTAIGERLRARLRGEVQLKGIPQPVRVWCVDALDASVPAGAVQPLVGREPERAQLAALVAAASETFSGGVVQIRGEPGIGKSRLAREVTRLAASQGFACTVASVLDFGAGRGRDAVHQLVRGLLGLAAGCDETERREAAHLAVTEGRIAEGHAALLSELLDFSLPSEQRLELDAMDEATRQARRTGVLTSLVETTCANAPVLMVVEDVHWADRAGLDALAAVARLTAKLPVVVVFTSRIDGDPIDDALRARFRPATFTRMELAPLRSEDALRLAEGLGAQGRLTADYVKRAAGNPLFLEQLVHHAEVADDRSVPPSIQSLIVARCDQLTSEGRAALQAASVLGQEFTLPALRHVMDNAGYHCGLLLARHLVRPDDEGFMFDHALIRECVYESMLRPRRQQLHRRAADWFSVSDVVLHAEHLDHADDPLATHALATAARAEFASYRGERALELAKRALARATAAERAEIACLAGEILQELGRTDAAIASYETALGAAGDEVWRCRARIGLAAAMRLADRLDDAYEQLDVAERSAERLGLIAELSRLHFLRGNLHFPLGRIDLCRREHDMALSAAEASGQPDLIVNALGGVGDAAFAQGRFRTALDCYRRCVELARERGLGRVEVANLVMIAIAIQLIGLPEGLAEAEATLAAATRVGHRRAQILALHAIAYWHFWALRGDFGRSASQRAVELCDRFGLSRFRAQSLAYLALAEHLAGNFDEADRLFETAIEDASRHSTRYFYLSVIGHYLQVVRDPRRRTELLAEGDQVSSTATLTHDFMHYYCGAIEAALASEDWSRAELYADRFERTFAAEPVARIDTCVRRARALAAWGRGDRTSELRRTLQSTLDDITRMDLGLYCRAVEDALADFRA